jgi:polar amino acid transport system substrate-binding protein
MTSRPLGLFLFAMLAAGANAEDLLVCTHTNAGFYASDGKRPPTGLEAEILTTFAAATGANLVFRDESSFEAVLKDTEAGRCQIGASTVTVNEERKSRFLFSAPYFPNRVVVVQKTSSGFTQAADLKGRRVAVVKGTLSTGFVAAIAGAVPVPVVDDAAAFAALLKGAADALACDSAVVLYFLSQHPDLGIAFPIGERSFFAFILPKDSKLGSALNAHIKGLVQRGEFKKMLARSFGDANAEFLASEVVGTAGGR